MRYPIYLNYDHTQSPIGFVEIEKDIPIDSVHDGAILPKLLSAGNGAPFKLASFGLVPRTEVDTRPREL